MTQQVCFDIRRRNVSGATKVALRFEIETRTNGVVPASGVRFVWQQRMGKVTPKPLHPAVTETMGTFGVVGPGLLMTVGSQADMLGLFRLLDLVAAKDAFPLTRNDFFRGWVRCEDTAALAAEVEAIRRLFADTAASAPLLAESGMTAEFLARSPGRTLEDICGPHLRAVEEAIGSMVELVKLTGPRDSYRIGAGPTSILGNARMSRLTREDCFRPGPPPWLTPIIQT